MIAFIPLLSASLFFFSALFSSEEVSLLHFEPAGEVQFDISLKASTKIEDAKTPLEMEMHLQFQGLIGILHSFKGSFPLPAFFSIHSATYRNQHLWDGTEETYNLQYPGLNPFLTELKVIERKIIPFSLLLEPPFFAFSPAQKTLYNGLSLFQNPFFSGFFAADLSNLFQIEQRLKKVGDKFDRVYEKNDQNAFQITQRFILKEISPQQVVIEVLSITERQKIFLDSGIEVVVYGKGRAFWTIDRMHSLLFEIQETSEISQSSLSLGVVTTTETKIERQFVTKRRHVEG